MINDTIIDKAISFAKRKHEGQLYGNQQFIKHPLQVFDIICVVYPSDIELQVAAILHDILENTDTDIEELNELFSEDIVSLVKEVTKEGYNTFPNLKTQRGIVLKFADRLANLSNIGVWSKKEQEKYINKSRFWRIK